MYILPGFRHYECRFADNDKLIRLNHKIIENYLPFKDISVAHEKAVRKTLRSSKLSSKKRLFNARSKKAIQLGKGSNLSTKRMQGNGLGPNTENIVFFPKNDQPVCQDITSGKNSKFSNIFS